jgi:hypothetical protein
MFALLVLSEPSPRPEKLELAILPGALEAKGRGLA